MAISLSNTIMFPQASAEKSVTAAASTAVSTTLYNITSQKLTTVLVGGASFTPNLAPLAAGGSPTSFSLSVAADCDMTVTFANGTSWIANLNVSLLAAGATLNLWCALNGFFGSTGTGNLQQVSWTLAP